MRLVGDDVGALRIDAVAHEFAEKLAVRDVAGHPYPVRRADAVRRCEAQRVRPESDFGVARQRIVRRQTDFSDQRRFEGDAAGGFLRGTPQEIDGADKARDEAVVRAVEEIHRRADLLDRAAVEHCDAVRDRQRFFLVVGHEYGGDAEFALQCQQLSAHVHAQLGVEIGKRFVQQQYFRFDRDSARHRDALLLAARELVRSARAVIGEPNEFERGRGAAGNVGARQLAFFEAERDVLRDCHMRPQRVILEHHADVAPPWRDARDVRAVDGQRAALRLVKAGDQSQQRRFATAGRPQQREELTGLDGEADVAQHLCCAEREVHVPDVNPDLGAGYRRLFHIQAPVLSICAAWPAARLRIMRLEK